MLAAVRPGSGTHPFTMTNASTARPVRLTGPRGWVSRLPGKPDLVSLVRTIDVPVRSVAQFEAVIGPDRQSHLVQAADVFRKHLADRTICNVSSKAVGGGVAEMLQVLIGYTEDLEIPIRWGVITGDAEFFVLTKRLHNQIHGDLAGGPISGAEAGWYAKMLAANAVELLHEIRPGYLVLLHDPQTAGLAAPLTSAGAQVAWRCHIGLDWQNEATAAAWSFLRPYLEPVQASVFSRREYVPGWMRNVAIIPPSIDPFSPKNEHLDDDVVQAILRRIGVVESATSDSQPTFTRSDGSIGLVTRSAEITADSLPGLRASGRSGIPVGSPQGHARRDARLRQVYLVRRTRLPDARRSGSRRSSRRPGGSCRVLRVPAPMAQAARLNPQPGHANHPSAGGSRRERRHGQCAATSRECHRAEEPRGRIRAYCRRGHVEVEASYRVGGRRHHRS